MFLNEGYGADAAVGGAAKGGQLARDAELAFASFGGPNAAGAARGAEAILDELYSATILRAVLPATVSSSAAVRAAAAEWMAKWWGAVVVDASKQAFLAESRGGSVSALATRLSKADARERGWIVVNASAVQLADLIEAGSAVGALGLHVTLRENGRAAAPSPAADLLDERCATVAVDVSDGARKDIARLQRVLLREAERAGASIALGCGQSLLQLEPQFYRVADLATFALEYAEGAPNIFAMVFFCIDELYETRAVRVCIFCLLRCFVSFIWVRFAHSSFFAPPQLRARAGGHAGKRVRCISGSRLLHCHGAAHCARAAALPRLLARRRPPRQHLLARALRLPPLLAARAARVQRPPRDER